jgi:hypothetical protein
VLVHRAHIEKTIALRRIRAKNEGPKSVAHFAVNYYVCATRTHTHTHTYTQCTKFWFSRRYDLWATVQWTTRERERREKEESKKERLPPKGVALFIA